MTINQIINKFKENHPKADTTMLELAFEFALKAHGGQKRKNGEPYIQHCLHTAFVLAQIKADLATVMAGLLHDIPEDTEYGLADIKKNFGSEVATLVEGITKLSKIKYRGVERYRESLRKMFLAMARDLRVVLVKLADRLHNMNTLSPLSPEKQIRIATETIEIYAPLAERLGMGEVKGQLEDLAFPYVYPVEFNRVINESKSYYKKSENYIKKMKRTLFKGLAKEGIKTEIHARKKHLFSLWRKLERPEIHWDFEKIHDIVALRILVDSIPQCYTALGVVHNLFKPIPYVGISDFIAQPKPNGYRSIHTKVFGPKGRQVEVQIRTKEMHNEAEYGIVAHWAYGEAKSKGLKANILDKIKTPEKLSWVKQLVEWQRSITDSKEFLRAVKFDALGHRNFVFSPKGDVFDLPMGATPVDFAYAVHTDLGNYIKGAKVDGKIVPLDYKLKSGQVVEILKSKNPKKPNRDWLDFVVTTAARNQLKKSLKN